ncbi:MAG TPA: hypothetical protein VIF62_39625 [Labilithrix sp.]|jgi:hypothetical protein
MKAIRFATMFVTYASIVVACTHASSSGDAPLAAAPPVDAAACDGACCTRPDPGSSCADFDGGSCTRAFVCPTSLVVSETETCSSGTWQITSGDCPAMGASDARGCPASPPAKGSPCTPPMGAPCGYVLTCSPTLSASAQATCVNGMWQSAPLSCD